MRVHHVMLCGDMYIRNNKSYTEYRYSSSSSKSCTYHKRMALYIHIIIIINLPVLKVSVA